MKTFLIGLLMAVFSLGMVVDADAKKRLGGGKSTGMQRDAVKPTTPAATPPSAAPVAPSAAPAAVPAAAGAATAAAAAAKPASGMSRWLGPLAGLAAGGLLASLFMGGAFSGLKMFDILLMVGLAIGAFMLFRMFMRKNATAAGPERNMQYESASAPAPREPDATPTPTPSAEPMQRTAAPEVERQGGRIVAPEIGSGLSSGNASPEVIEAATAAPCIPADFDIAPFERNSRAAFIRLQAANDAGDLADIRDFTTPEMYAEVSLQIQERGSAPQRTEVVSLNVRVLEVVTENDRAIASVRYTGVMREDGVNEGFDEVWHVVKNLKDDKSTWRLAGIQQLDA